MRTQGAPKISQSLRAKARGLFLLVALMDYKKLIDQAVQKHGLPPEWSEIGYRQLFAESAGNPKAVSPKGAQGLMQFMPKTAKAYGLKNPNDPAQSVDAWARMTKDLIQQTGGNPAHVLAAYNWGSGNLSKHGMQKAPAETRQYIQKILGDMPIGTRRAEADAAPSYGPVIQTAGAMDAQEAIAQDNQPVQASTMPAPGVQVAQGAYAPGQEFQTNPFLTEA